MKISLVEVDEGGITLRVAAETFSAEVWLECGGRDAEVLKEERACPIHLELIDAVLAEPVARLLYAQHMP